MKSLLPFVILCYSLVSAVPFNDAQVVLDRVPSAQDIFKVTNGLKHSVADYLQDSKKEILKGKVNMQKWMHAGKEYIMQDNLLCKLTIPKCINGEVNSHIFCQTSISHFLLSAPTN